MCTHTKFFSQRMLVIVDPATGEELTLEQIGGYTDETMPIHMNDDQIMAQLKMSTNKIKAWIETIEDAAELHSIYEVAKSMDLPASKLKLLASYMPEKDFLAE